MDLGAGNPRTTAKLHTSRIKLAEAVRNVWSISPAVGTKIEDLLKPEYWSFTAARLAPSDRIEVEPEDGSYFAQLRVLQTGNGWATVQLLSKLETASTSPAPTTDDFDVEYRGPHAKHVIIRKSDKHVMKEGISLKQDAYAEISRMIRELA